MHTQFAPGWHDWVGSRHVHARSHIHTLWLLLCPRVYSQRPCSLVAYLAAWLTDVCVRCGVYGVPTLQGVETWRRCITACDQPRVSACRGGAPSRGPGASLWGMSKLCRGSSLADGGGRLYVSMCRQLPPIATCGASTCGASVDSMEGAGHATGVSFGIQPCPCCSFSLLELWGV